MLINNIIKQKLEKSNIEIGDRILVENKSLKKEGVLMPHHQFSDDDIITIKLDNGYNIGVSVDKKTKIKLLKKHKKHKKTPKKIPFDKNKPIISLVGTGGTIACYVDYRTGAVFPASSSEDLAFSVPEIFDICNVKTQVAFQILSENIEVNYWKGLAKIVADELNNNARGVVIPHGTDTMGYTGAALSFLLKNLNGPVVLVGSQRSSDRPSSDAALNLLSAAQVAAESDIGEVLVVMHDNMSDKKVAIHRANKVRKMHTSRRDAFKSVNDTPIGYVEDGRIKITEKYQKKKQGKVKIDDKIEENVGMVYIYPGVKPGDIPDKKGVVLIGTGLGHIPEKIIPRIKELAKKDTFFVMTSQCLFGRINMNVYSTGRDLIKAGIIPGEDMLPETAYVKLMWALGHSKKREEVEKIIKENIAGEISDRTKTNCYF